MQLTCLVSRNERRYESSQLSAQRFGVVLEVSLVRTNAPTGSCSNYLVFCAYLGL